MSSSTSSPPSCGKLFLATNWKGSIETPDEADALVQSMNKCWEKELDDEARSMIQWSVHPPAVFLDRVRQHLLPTIAVGAQNSYDSTFTVSSSDIDNPKNTGSTTTGMIAALQCEWVLLGHSDRRNNLGETDALIASKAKAALQAGLGILVAVGELKEQRDKDETMDILHQQVSAVASAVSTLDEWHRVVLAYEPVWAVGDGAIPCAPTEAQRIHASLREWIASTVSPEAAQACRITYTGSVNVDNASGYAAMSDVQGFVLGRAGLDAQQLLAITKTLAKAKRGKDEQ